MITNNHKTTVRDDIPPVVCKQQHETVRGQTKMIVVSLTS
jgi:hypothetical protein